MVNAIIERQIEGTIQDVLGDKAVRIARGISKIAAKQGGDNVAENYRLLGKRALIVVGVAFVAVQATTSVVGLIASRKRERQRVERIVREVLEEERQEQEDGR